MKLISSVILLVAFFCYQGFGEHQRRKQVQEEYWSGQCLEKNARYAVSDQCDKYVECTDGEPEEKLCSDGLLFNDRAGIFTYPCQYPIDVNCTTRARTQPPQPTEECPHQFGYFKLGDRANCGTFLNCAEGRGYTLNCPQGLAYNPANYQCDWPDLVEDCDPEAFLRFTCPPETRVEGFGPGQTKYYRSEEDCQRYFSCNGGHPRLNVCGLGTAFDENLNRCEAAQNVTGCEHLAIIEEDEEKEPIYLKTLKIRT